MSNATGATVYVMQRPSAAINHRPIDKNTLEAIIDLHGLTEVVRMLSEICAEKAEHILINWNDKELACLWNKRCVQLDEASAKLPKMW
jgi:hypothetical protein